MGKMTLKREPLLKTKHKSYSYQIEAIKAIRDLKYGAIFHEQGLGKTKIAIDILLYWLENKFVDTVLLVVKKSLIHNWILELKEHCYIRGAILSQNKNRNFQIFNGPARLIITNYEVIKSEKERMRLFLKARDVGVILDESTKIKNPNSKLTQAFFQLSKLFKKKIIMTGTPIANRPYDVWAQIYFLDKGKSLGTNYRKFKKDLDLTNRLFDDQEKQKVYEENISNIFSKINHFVIRETKKSGVINLPEKVYRNIETEWESIQYEKYAQVRKELKIIIIKEGIPKEDISENDLKRLLRLIQLASNPKIIDDEYNRLPGKVNYLESLFVNIFNKREKCIVWSNFIKNINFLHKHFKKHHPVKLHGKMDMFQRNRAIENFKDDENVKVLFATPGAAKEGLTLTTANHVIYFDRGFSLDDYLQSQDRIHRISQEKTCYIYNLIMKDSIDEWIDVLLNAKHLSAQLSQNDISIDYFRSQISYDFGEIIKQILQIE